MHNSQSQASPASSFPEEGQSALDGSEPATEDEIRELQQIEDFFRQYDCLPENYRSLSEDAHHKSFLSAAKTMPRELFQFWLHREIPSFAMARRKGVMLHTGSERIERSMTRGEI